PMGAPHRCTRPGPAVTIKIWPSGWVCHAVRAPGSNVTREPDARAGAFAWNRGSTRTEPVKFSADPCREGCEPLRMILIAPSSLGVWLCAPDASMQSDIAIAEEILIVVPSARPSLRRHLSGKTFAGWIQEGARPELESWKLP